MHCKKIYPKPGMVKNHERTCDPNWVWDCDKCGKEFDNYRKLNGHKGSCGRIRKSKNPSPRTRMVNPDGHICKWCEKEFKSGQSLGGHVPRCKKNPSRIPPPNWKGKKHKQETKRKQRLGQIAHIERRIGYQMKPAYNPDSISIIEEYGTKFGFNFQHAENGGEFYVKELGYWVDAYDAEKNVVLEYDESHHFNSKGNLKKKDIKRQKEIEEHLDCRFIRIRHP